MAIADLEVYDDDGTVVLNANTLFGRVLARFQTGTVAGSVLIPDLIAGVGFFFSVPTNVPFVACLPVFTVRNGSISWAFTDFIDAGGQKNAPRANCNVIVVQE